MTDYDVPHDKGDWVAKRAGAGTATGRYDTPAETHTAAVRFPTRSGGGGGGGEVRDHRKDNNEIPNTDTVGNKDSSPPKG